MHAIQVIKDKQDTQWQIVSAVFITRTEAPSSWTSQWDWTQRRLETRMSAWSETLDV